VNAPNNFFADGNDIRPSEVAPELQTVIENWQAAIAQRRIGFLPRAHVGRLYWYGFAPTARDRRELLSLLDCWIGPTYSDLARGRGELDLQDPFDAALDGLPIPPLRFEVLPRTRPAARQSRDKVRTGLQMMSRMIDDRPTSEFDVPRTTVEVLDDLGHAISARDRSIALDLLRELEASADLDQTNLAFVRFRIYAGLEDWAAVLGDDDLEHILAMRRPIGITRAVQHAVYGAYLEAADQSGSAEDLLAASVAVPSQFRLLSTNAVPSQRSEFVVEALLAMRAGKPRSAIERLISEATQAESGLDVRLRRLHALELEGADFAHSAPEAVQDDQAPPGTENSGSTNLVAEAIRLSHSGDLAGAIAAGLSQPPGRDMAPHLVIWARELADTTVATQVNTYLQSNGLRGALEVGSASLRADLSWLDALIAPSRTLGWRGWLAALAETSHVDHLDVDLEASADWERLDRHEVLGILEAASDLQLGRFGEHGGAFMAAHRELFAGDEAASLIERVLAGLVMSGKNSIGVRVQTLALVDLLVDASASAADVTFALEWIGEIVRQNVSAGTATWAVDVLQAATSSPLAIALAAKQALFFDIVGLVRPVRSALDLTDLAAIKVVAEELGLDFPDDFNAGLPGEADAAEAFRHLEGLKIVLYSLTESATTRAAQTLRNILPGIDVKTIAEHVGSQQLAAASASADVFVVVTASAKHAATDFIKANRGNKATLHVNSRGSSMILKALAEG
jgi:hypothetical protein